jgi:hypothetical protein
MLLVLFALAILWIVYEVWRAPLIDDNYNTIVPAKKLMPFYIYKKLNLLLQVKRNNAQT